MLRLLLAKSVWRPLWMKHLVLSKGLVTTARALMAFSFDPPIVHMKKLRLSKVKEIAHGHPGENAGKIPPLAPLNWLSARSPLLCPSPGLNQEHMAKKLRLLVGARKLRHAVIVPHPNQTTSTLQFLSGWSSAGLYWDLGLLFQVKGKGMASTGSSQRCLDTGSITPFMVLPACVRRDLSSVQPRVGQKVSWLPLLQGPGPECPCPGHWRGPLICGEGGGRRSGEVGWLICLQTWTPLFAPWLLHQETIVYKGLTSLNKIRDSTHSWLLNRQIHFHFTTLLSGDLFVNVKRNDTGTITRLCKSMHWKSRKSCTERMLILWSPRNGKLRGCLGSSRAQAKTWVHPVQPMAGFGPGA